MKMDMHDAPNSPFDQAAAWVARLDAPDCTAAERAHFEDWLAQDPAHVHAWTKAETLHQRREALAAELEAVQSQLSGHAPEVRAMAGAIVTLDREGHPLIHRGLLREAEAKALRALDAARQRTANGQPPGDDGSDSGGSTASGCSSTASSSL